MAGDKDQRTEQATPKKRKDERKKGNVFSSKDVINLATVLVAFYSLKLLFPYIVDRLGEMLFRFSGYAAVQKEININYAMLLLRDLSIAFLITVLPIAVATAASAIIATGAQTRFLFSGDALKPKFSRMNPMEGFKKMFSMKSLIEVLKSSLKVLVILYLLYGFFTDELVEIARTMRMDLLTSIPMILNAVMRLVNNICLAFVAMAALDYMYQRWDYAKNLRMTKQEVKEEYKQLEGDPQIKGKIKERQRQFAQSRMMQAVPTADVVIRNPTHYAVALRYDMQRDNAPVVVAKGADSLAQRIVQVAEKNNVYVTEQPALCRAIYAQAEVNGEIPLDFYQAVAEILALVYQLKTDKEGM